jgi:hypothetical protein
MSLKLVLMRNCNSLLLLLLLLLLLMYDEEYRNMKYNFVLLFRMYRQLNLDMAWITTKVCTFYQLPVKDPSSPSFFFNQPPLK